jgi:class 3 adenylate cyclase
MAVQRTFAFLDLCGFTAYTEACGEERAVAVLAHLRATLRERAASHSVRVTKWLGDGAMLSSVGREPLVACVLETRDDVAGAIALPLRAGIAEGRAIMFEGDDYVGPAVNIAARLAQRARPNQVLATARVADRLLGMVTLRPCQALRVRGVERPIRVRELLTTTRPHSRRAAVGGSSEVAECRVDAMEVR